MQSCTVCGSPPATGQCFAYPGAGRLLAETISNLGPKQNVDSDWLATGGTNTPKRNCSFLSNDIIPQQPQNQMSIAAGLAQVVGCNFSESTMVFKIGFDIPSIQTAAAR